MLPSLLRTFPWSAKRAALIGAAKSPLGRVATKLLIFNYLQAVLSFAVSIWLAKELGEDAYGVIGYGFTLAAISSTLVDFGSERTLVRDLTHADDANSAMTASIGLRFMIALVVSVGGLGWLHYSQLAEDHRWPLVLCSLSGMLFGLSPKGWYDYQYQMGTQAGIMFAEKVLYCVFTVGLVLLFPKSLGVLIVAACLLGSRLASFVAQWWQVSQSFSPKVHHLKSELAWVFSQNAFVAAAAFGNLMAPHVNGLQLGHLKGPAAMAHFFLAFQVVAVVQILQQVAVRMLVPRIAEVTSPGNSIVILRNRFIRFSLYSLAITLLLVIPLMLCSGWVIEKMLPAGFQASILPLRLLLLSCIAHSIGLVINHFLICLRCNAHYFATSVGKGLAAILLGWLLIPDYGANGVALTILLCATLTMAVQWGLAWNAISRRENSLHSE